ncbi:TPA: anaerobic C4-dicarboxylate transporter DcuC [Escherichia coli]|uniref:C4-dicarboxylate transporter DcuC n=1 Tax=Escherichia coli TaxID=562 RepID=UPI000BE46151|nr:C4-dicarboxylate transporter DcuC [Escherichia coli]ELT1855002.1 C4-dicarboxylate transporter DcuC [Escherichia coli]MCS1189389.1 C4-dicarboxylate transporter DcuC [Escherichia coli]MDJ1223768.1 TRAP transporter large permease subunit [Escherichia coli]TFQ95821.1 TRAP transporter large permease subunit [Escherichia coli]HAJ6125664.1 TRAP transporter large permease subunit [Escherichia coli]
MFNVITGCVILIITVVLLIKRYDTRTTLIGAGLLLCIVAMSPLNAFSAFASRMTESGLIQAICTSMGFACVMKFTGCDTCLVHFLTKGLSRLGIFLIPAAVTVSFIICIAIPSAAGASAAVGATLIPLLISARIHPAIAGAAILSGTIGAYLNPGVAHNAFISKISQTPLMEFVVFHTPTTITCGVICAVILTVVAIVRKETKCDSAGNISEQTQVEFTDRGICFYLKSVAPFLPIALLMLAEFGFLGETKITVPAAMILGCLYALIVSKSNPKELVSSFFEGMGTSYANILGIIIAAAVFIEGLKSVGIIDVFIRFLIDSPEFARWGGTLGPFLMGLITGTGDATAFAFNEVVTPHANNFGYDTNTLGAAVMLASALGRNMSPLAGATIICAGLAEVNPVEIAKRTAPGMIVTVLFIALLFL